MQVAEGLGTRQEFLHWVLLRSVERDLAVIVISVLVVILGVFMALRPWNGCARMWKSGPRTI